MAEGGIKTCFICKKSDTDKFNYGNWESIDSFDVHYYCLVSICDGFDLVLNERNELQYKSISHVCV